MSSLGFTPATLRTQARRGSPCGYPAQHGLPLRPSTGLYGDSSLPKVEHMETITLNNGVRCPPSGSGCSRPLRTRPATPYGRPSVPATGTSTPRPRTATSARSGRPLPPQTSTGRRCSSRPRSGSATTATKRPCTGSRRAPRKLGVDQIDLLILHQALPSDFERTLGAYRALETLLDDGKVRAIGVSNFMVDHLQGLLERSKIVPAVNQIEAHPYFSQRAVQSVRRRARHHHPGLVAHRRHHLLPRRQPHQHPRGPGDRRHRPRPRQDPRAGHAPLGSAARTLGDPEVDQAAAHRGEHRRLRLRANRATRSPTSTSWTPGPAGGPEPDAITLESFGRDIPEE